MVARGDLAISTAKSTQRSRNKVTTKSRIRVIHGDLVDAERAFGEEDLQDSKALAAGVDAEDASEFHLLAALEASQKRNTSSFCQPSTSRKNNLAPPPPQPSSYIPTPDATGKVDNYAEYYPDIKWEPPTLLLKSSATVEEMQDDSLGGGYAYVLDERDAEWLEKNNKAANGEGSSTSNLLRNRSAKARGKEPESSPPVPISEDEFELVMGLFERVTDEKFPYLHLSPTELPTFSIYEQFFSNTLPAHYFPSYTIPPSVPPSATLSRYARIIYPHWRDRKLERGGRRIIPQLNYDESNDSDPYVCFRRREVKPVRKTRRQDNSSLDRMLKLQEELLKVLDIGKVVQERELAKVEAVQEMRSVSEKRARLVELKRKGGSWGLSDADENLLVDRAARRKERPDGMANTIRLRRPLPPYDPNGTPGYAPQQPLAAGELHQAVLAKVNELQARIDAAAAKRKEPGWEDLTEGAYQPLPLPLPLKHFKSIPTSEPASPFPFSFTAPTSLSFDMPERPRNGRSAVAMRMRVGRGGRMVVDRRATATRHPLDRSRVEGPGSFMDQYGFMSKTSVYPSSAETSPSSSPDSETGPSTEPDDSEMLERAWRIDEQWRYDADAGLPVSGAGLADVIGEDEDPRLILDDYDHGAFNVRKNILIEEDFISLKPDEAVLRRAETLYELRKEQEKAQASEAIAKAALIRKEIAARQPQLPANPPAAMPQVPVAVGANSATAASNPIAAAMANVANGNPAILAQLKKVRQMQQAQGSAPGGVGRPPHPLATSLIPSPGQQTPSAASSPTVASAPAQTSPVQTDIPAPVATPAPQPIANGIAANGATSKIGSSPSSHPQTNGNPQTPASTQSPILNDTNGVPRVSVSPEQRPKSQPQASGMTAQVPMQLSHSSMGNGFMQTNGVAAAYPNGMNGVVGNGMMPMQVRTNGLVNGTGAMVNGANGMVNGLTAQQAMGLKNVFNNVSQQQQAQMINSMTQQQLHANYAAAMGMNGLAGLNVSMNGLNGLVLNGNGSPQSVQNMNLALGNGNISLKLPAQRAMQWAAANKDGTMMASPNGQQRQQQSASPMLPNGSMSPANGQRLRASPHLQNAAIAGRVSPAMMNGVNQSPHVTPQMPHAPSPLAGHQQAVGGPAQGHMNGF